MYPSQTVNFITVPKGGGGEGQSHERIALLDKFGRGILFMLYNVYVELIMQFSVHCSVDM